MSWNYRVIRRKAGSENKEYYYSIHEVYYSEGVPNGVTMEEVAPSGDSLEELRQSFELYKKAFERKALDYDTLKELDD